MIASLPSNIAGIQWNNRLKSVFLTFMFLFGVLAFALTLVMMISVPIALFVPDPKFRLDNFMDNGRLHLQVLKFFLKILFFSLGATLFFIWKNISKVDRVMMAKPFKLTSSDTFYRELENLCISRGLRMPDLYMFENRAVPRTIVTAAVMQGLNGQWALIVTEAAYRLPPPLREALLAQAVQRVYTKDTLFLTLFCFLGYFPYHVANGTNAFGRILFKLPLAAADLVLKPLRPHVLDLRLARLDVGSLELTKEAGPMAELMTKLPRHAEISTYFYDPFLALFIARSAGSYRESLFSDKQTKTAA
ncbi:MAG: hypothetical protein ACAH83_19975 [Alphaproteobacteria bacterium]